MNQTLDIHGYSVSEAKVMIDNYINSMTVGELTIIHGYSSNVLQTFVRKQYRNSKVKKVIITMNPGETIFVIK